MSDFDPGPGWREVTADEYVEHGTGHGPRLNMEDSGAGRFWVREVPVPALPTASWSVGRFYGGHFNPAGSVMVLDDFGTWKALYDRGIRWERADKMKYDRFEILAEPRAITAKALMERLETLKAGDGNDWREQILREFGVES